MKRFISLLLIFIMVLSLVPFSAFSVGAETSTDSQGVEYTLSYDETYYYVSGCDSSATTVVIPETYNGLPVKEIGGSAFYECDYLTSIEIPNSVTYIGGSAFGECISLTSIEIPASVNYIGEWAFDGCSGLETITVANENETYHSKDNCLIETATKTLIRGCKNSIIPSDGSVTAIGDSAFYYCKNLTSIEIPDSVTIIDDYAFSGCSDLTSIEIPALVTYIGDWAIDGCSGLETITVANGNETYHSKSNCLIETATKTLIRGCKNSDIPSDGSVTSIGFNAFSNCFSLTNIVIPNSVTYIGYDAFFGCENLTSVYIPNSVETIEEYAFEGCTSLTSIEIPASVNYIGEYAFYGCTSLTDIYCEAESQPEGWDSDWLNDCSATVHWGVDMGNGDSSDDSSVPTDDQIEDPSVDSSDDSSDDVSSEEESSEDESSEYDPEPTAKKGDINGNGQIDHMDYLYLKRVFFEQYVLDDIAVGDINNNDQIDSMDYLYLKRAFFKQYVISDEWVENYDGIPDESVDESVFTMDISVPDYYSAGEEVVVTVTVKNPTTALHSVYGVLEFDNDILGLLVEPVDGAEVKGNVITGFSFSEWENLSRYKVAEDGTVSLELIALTVGCEDEETYEYMYTDNPDGLQFNIEFIAKADATGDAVVSISGETVIGQFVDEDSSYTTTVYNGYGSSATIPEYEEPLVSSEEESSDESSEEESSEVVSSEVESSDEDLPVESSDIESSEDPIVTPTYTNVALGKSYDAKGFAATDEWGTFDYTADLTDGIAAGELTFDNNWFAFCTSEGDYGINAPNGVGSVTIDLENVYALTSFRVNAVVGINVDRSGVNGPSRVSVYVSDTANGEYTYVGDLTTDSDADVAWLELEADATGRFVKIEVTLNGSFAFINEVQVYGAEATEDDSSVEDDSDIESSDDPIVTPTYTNVALGKSYDAKGYKCDYWSADYTANLTDGVAYHEFTYDNNWFAFCTSEGDYGINAPDGVGSVTIDLENVYALTSFRVNAVVGINVDYSGVNCPSRVSVYVSDTVNGEYTYVGDLTTDSDADVAWLELEADATGRFVKIEVTLNGSFAFINEVEVYGAEATEDDSSVEDDSEIESSEESVEESSEDSSEDSSDEEAVEGAFTMDISAPEEYVAGEEITVTVTVNNVNTSEGLHGVEGNLYFDEEILGFDFDLEDNKYIDAFRAFAEWEDFTQLQTDGNGTWWIKVCAMTAGYDIGNDSWVYTDQITDGQLVFKITFTAKSDATGETVVNIPDETVYGEYVNPYSYEITEYVGCGSTVTISEAKELSSSYGELTFTLSEDGTYYIVSDCQWDATSVVIPETYNGLPVKEIGDHAFYYCYNLTSVTLGNSVETIDYGAFYGCSNLISIKIPASVTYIGSGAFTGCSALETMTVESGNEVYHSNGNCIIKTETKTLVAGCKNSVIPTDKSVTTIGDYAFECCYNLESITIPDSVTYIGYQAFISCDNLTSIEISNSVTYIGNSAFFNCDSLTSVTFGNSVETIDDYAFEDCYSLTSIEIPASVTYIGDRAFAYCESLETMTVASGNEVYHSNGNCIIETATKTLVAGCKNSVIPTDGSVTTIGDSAFAGSSSLESIVIPNSVTAIGDNAFYSCDNLTSVTLGNSLETIGNGAFRYCDSLTSIEISASVTHIGYYAFAYCESLETMTVASGNEVYHSNGNCIIETETKTLVAGCKNSVIPTDKSVTTIGYGAFSGCSSLTSIEIPDSVTTIGNSAFENCYALTSIEIPDSVTTIGEYAFEDCSSLTSIEIPDSVSLIESYAFRDCYNLTDVKIPETAVLGINIFDDCSNITFTEYENIIYYGSESNPYQIVYGLVHESETYTIHPNAKQIAGAAFGWCDILESIKIPDSVIIISDYAFEDCHNLTSIKLGNSVETIGSYAFAWCYDLASINIPNSVTTIGEGAFSDCYNLTSIKLGNSVTTIGRYAFYGCNGLTSINIPNSVTTIGEGAFYDCESLTSIVVPASVITIGNYAFQYCDSLTRVTLGNSVEIIGKDAFAYCSSLTSIEIPNSVTTIGEGAFSDCYNLTSIKLGNSVTTIGRYAFYCCSSLTSIVIPASVTAIGENAFAWCDSLNDIYCEAESQPDGWAVEYSDEDGYWYGDWNEYCYATVHWGSTGPEDTNDDVDYEYGDDVLGDIVVEGDNAFADGTTVKVESLGDVDIPSSIGGNYANTYGFDITAYKDGEVVQPTDNVTVTLSVPDGFSMNLSVYHVSDDGTMEKITISIDTANRKVTMVLSHFSKYILVDEDSKATFMKGDINGNGTIDSMDYLYLKRAFFKQYVLTDISIGDINGNGTIDSMDYLYLKRAFFKQYVIE